MTTEIPTGRLELVEHAPRPYAAMARLDAAIELDPALRELVKLRASQLNGCAFCIDMHWNDARAHGETEARLYLLDAWQESGLYSQRERAALALCDALTFVSDGHVPDPVWETARGTFDEGELAQLVFAITAINAWNRLAITSRTQPGRRPPAAASARMYWSYARMRSRKRPGSAITMEIPTERIRLTEHAPGPYAAMARLEAAIELDPGLRELVRLRASQVNGCAFCIDMHWKDARAAGESEARLYSLDAWRESRRYSERERAALALSEAVTLVADGHVSDAVWQAAQAVFPDAELAQLVFAITAINAWNRLAIATRMQPGHYVPAVAEETAGGLT